MGYLSDYEIEALQPPPEQSVREWVEHHRILPVGNAEPGPKRISRTPSLAIVYDWFGDYHVKEILMQSLSRVQDKSDVSVGKNALNVSGRGDTAQNMKNAMMFLASLHKEPVT